MHCRRGRRWRCSWYLGRSPFPIKLLALWLIEAGRPLPGLAVIVAAKLLGTALVGRLFILLEPQLREFGWFVRGLDWWRVTRAQVVAAVHASGAVAPRARRAAGLANLVAARPLNWSRAVERGRPGDEPPALARGNAAAPGANQHRACR